MLDMYILNISKNTQSIQYVHIVQPVDLVHSLGMSDDRHEENKTAHVHLLMSPTEVRDIDNWGFEHRIRTRGATIRSLAVRGMVLDTVMSIAILALAIINDRQEIGDADKEFADDMLRLLLKFEHSLSKNDEYFPRLEQLLVGAKKRLSEDEGKKFAELSGIDLDSVDIVETSPGPSDDKDRLREWIDEIFPTVAAKRQKPKP